MIRLARVEDAEQLEELNNAFNGAGETSLENIRRSLLRNTQELVVVAEEDGALTGFLCVQLKKSFCYDDLMPEITELYVAPACRRRGLARGMMDFAAAHCKAHFPCHKLELLTGRDNAAAQRVYEKAGFSDDGEVHLSRQI